MTLNKISEETPWWKSELLNIRDKHRVYLRRHLPALRSDHDDLMSDTLLGLITYIESRPNALPPSWFKPSSPTDETERERLYKLAMLILKRRVADLFRQRSSQQTFLPIDEPAHEVPDSHVPPDRQILLERLLEVTGALLDEMTPKDRDLVALLSKELGFRKSLNPRERKRLQRLRKRLKDEVTRRLGLQVAELLRIP
ncbi:MAG: hypothetical protein QOE77_22 [Blastocatellia bacterium]|nr:hypothetical protein [Blastocatellia bacterium]